MTCAHPIEGVRLVDNAVHEEQASRLGPLLLWCSACGGLTWTDGEMVVLAPFHATPPDSSSWVPPWQKP